MFTLTRVIKNHITGRDVCYEKYKYEDLLDALDRMEKLRKADLARYKLLMIYHCDLYYDDSQGPVSYHFIVGKCEIYCEIEGVYEDAVKEFFIKQQLGSDEYDD